MTENNDIDKFIVINDLKQRGKKGKISGKYIYLESGSRKYIIKTLNENKKVSVKEIEDFVAFSSKVDKESVIAIVDKYGDVSYYFLSEIKLNKKGGSVDII